MHSEIFICVNPVFMDEKYMFLLISKVTKKSCCSGAKSVVYFDQLLGAAHPKIWSKSLFSLAEKMRKKQEICSKILQKTRFF